MPDGWVRNTPANPRPRDWPRRRARVLKRDGHRCQLADPARCIGTATEVDHVVARWQGGSHEEDNLRAVCTPCHAHRTAVEANHAKPQRRRPAQAHPGLARSS